MLVARLSAFLLDHLLMALLLFFSRELGLVSFLAALKLPSLVLYWGLYLSFYMWPIVIFVNLFLSEL